jgi:hypothetical protein
MLQAFASSGWLNRDYIEDSDYLTSTITDIANGVKLGLPLMDHIEIDRLFAAKRAVGSEYGPSDK